MAAAGQIRLTVVTLAARSRRLSSQQGESGLGIS